MTATRTKVTISGSCEGSPLGLYTIQATTSDGRRFLYGYPDGQPRDGFLIRELNEFQFDALVIGIGTAGGIDTSKPCWIESDPVYGSVAYEMSGTEQQWANRERAETARC